MGRHRLDRYREPLGVTPATEADALELARTFYVPADISALPRPEAHALLFVVVRAYESRAIEGRGRLGGGPGTETWGPPAAMAIVVIHRAQHLDADPPPPLTPPWRSALDGVGLTETELADLVALITIVDHH